MLKMYKTILISYIIITQFFMCTKFVNNHPHLNKENAKLQESLIIMTVVELVRLSTKPYSPVVS